MQLKLKRSQRPGGLTGGIPIFCLDARVDLSGSELADVRRYKLGGEVIYNSEAARRALEAGGRATEAAFDRGIGLTSVNDFLFSTKDTISHGLKAVAHGALSRMSLRVTIDSLARGHHIECKGMDELLGAEHAIMSACENLRGYLATAATFDSREVVIEFTDAGPVTVADATPATALITSPMAPEPGPMPFHDPETAHEPALFGTAGSGQGRANDPLGAFVSDLRLVVLELQWNETRPLTRVVLIWAMVALGTLVGIAFHPNVMVFGALALVAMGFAIKATRELL